MQSLPNQKPANHIIPFAMLGGKKKTEKPILARSRNHRAGGKESSSAQSQKAFNPKKREKKIISVQREEVVLNMQFLVASILVSQ